MQSRPPRFRFTVNDTSLVTRDYGYWVENELRERFDLEGVPVTIDFRAAMKAVVVGGGSWGTGFSRLLADHEFDVTLAVRDPDDADAISLTGRNPHYLERRRPGRNRGGDDRRRAVRSRRADRDRGAEPLVS